MIQTLRKNVHCNKISIICNSDSPVRSQKPATDGKAQKEGTVASRNRSFPVIYFNTQYLMSDYSTGHHFDAKFVLSTQSRNSGQATLML